MDAWAAATAGSAAASRTAKQARSASEGLRPSLALRACKRSRLLAMFHLRAGEISAQVEAGLVEAGERPRQEDALHDREDLVQLVGPEHPGGGRRLAAAARGDDAVEHADLDAGHDQLEEEAVELGLGQRVGALQLDGVPRGEDEER